WWRAVGEMILSPAAGAQIMSARSPSPRASQSPDGELMTLQRNASQSPAFARLLSLGLVLLAAAALLLPLTAATAQPDKPKAAENPKAPADTASGPEATLFGPASTPLQGEPFPVLSVAFSPDGKSVAAATGQFNGA